jgi:hypothetical protein
MANLFNQRGEKLRTGVAGVKKCLMEPDRISEDSILSDTKIPRDEYGQEIPGYAMVWNDIDGEEVYLSRHGNGKDCVFNLTFWEGDVEFSEDFTYKQRDDAIESFLQKVKQ